MTVVTVAVAVVVVVVGVGFFAIYAPALFAAVGIPELASYLRIEERELAAGGTSRPAQQPFQARRLGIPLIEVERQLVFATTIDRTDEFRLT